MPPAAPKSSPSLYSPARSELHRSIWSISNSLRGSTGVDSQTFQSCVLVILFYCIPLPPVDEQEQAVEAVRTLEELSSRLDAYLSASRSALSDRTKWWHEVFAGVR